MEKGNPVLVEVAFLYWEDLIKQGRSGGKVGKGDEE